MQGQTAGLLGRSRRFLVVAAIVVAWGLAPARLPVAASAPTGSWTTFNGSNTHVGSDTADPPIKSVAPAWTAAVSGDVYGQALVSGSHEYVATEKDMVYDLNPLTGQPTWSLSLGNPVPAVDTYCSNIDPLGVTSTPVLVGTLLMVAAYIQTAPNSDGNFVLFALDTTHSPATIAWQQPLTGPGGVPGLTARTQNQRGALLYANGNVYLPFGGRGGGPGGPTGDCGVYHGWMVGLPATGPNPGLPNNGLFWFRTDSGLQPDPAKCPCGAAFWAMGGPVADSAGNLYAVSGNATNGKGGNAPNSRGQSQTVFRLSPQLALLQRYRVSNWRARDLADSDLGSMGPVLVDGGYLFVAGKGGIAYLLDSNNLSRGPAAKISRLCGGGDFIGTASYAAGTIYAPCSNGFYAFHLAVGGTPLMSVLWSKTGYGASPAVVAMGFVWELNTSAALVHVLKPGDGSEFASVTLATGVPRFTGLTAVDGIVSIGAGGYVFALTGPTS